MIGQASPGGGEGSVGKITIEPGSVWVGYNHGSRWMAFDSGRPGVVNLWCMDPGTSPTYRAGSIVSPAIETVPIMAGLESAPRGSDVASS